MPLPFIIGGLAAIGSAITGGAAAAGAAAAGVAAAAGTAAAAAGTAVASTAVGSAVVGAATTAGAAVASSAVGSAAVGAMTAVGTGVGAIAGAASSVPVIGAAAGTVASMTAGATGAAAVGTIATTGAIGVANGVAGAAKLAEAGEIKDAALSQYNTEKRKFENAQENTNTTLKALGEEKLKIWKSFDRFSTMYSKIQNPPVMDGKVEEESLSLSPDELDNIKAVAIGAKDLLSGGVASVGVGNLIGLATSGGLVSSITVASTGTAISTLSGAAATNATLAALGGGSLAAGGAGMAGGAAALSGLTFAPMIMVGGIMLNGKAKKTLESAKDVEHEVELAVDTMQTAEKELSKVCNLSNKIRAELDKLNTIYAKLMDYMEGVVQRHTDYTEFTIYEKKNLEKTILSLKLLKKLSMQNILDSKNGNTVLQREVDATLKQVSTAREEKLN